jgi:hypothetical protein
MPDFRSCTIRGEHTVRCDGKEYRYVEKRHRDETTGRLCTGCLPRLAQKGLLCWGCWERVEEAFIKWTPFAEQTLAVLDRAVQRDTGGRTSGPEGYVPIPGTKLAVDEIRSYLRAGAGGSAEAWVSTVEGAKNAVRFARAVPAALRTHELEEKAHKIRRTRCSECKQLTLVWNPPQHSHDRVTVTCSNSECGAQLDQGSFAMLAQIEETDKTRKAADRGRA